MKALRYAFRITHIDNIPHIIKYGIVKPDSPNRNPRFVAIGDPEIIRTRGQRIVKGYNLSDFIPFYFGPRSPMLYVIQHGYNGVRRLSPEDIVYCVVRLDNLLTSDISCVFTDGHALNILSEFYQKNDLVRVDEIVRYDDVYSSRWDSSIDIDLKRRKEAELLVKDDLPEEYIKGFVVYNENARNRLIDVGVSPERVVIAPQYYF